MSKTEKIPLLEISEDKMSKAFYQSKKDNFTPVEIEKGWKVLLGGVWMKKRNGNVRTYASLESAKAYVEKEFFFSFKLVLKIQYSDVHDECWKNRYPNYPDCSEMTHPSTWTAPDWYKIEAKAFRNYMKWLYKNEFIQYVEYIDE